MPADERVLVIPAERLRAAGDFHGFRPADDAFRAALLDPVGFEFRPRSEVETDPTFLQLIPYVVLTWRGDVFHYFRGAAGTETRLRSLRSVGIGGHISEDDAAGDDAYRSGMMRELSEEVAIGCGWAETFLGFIHDPRTPVGRVHLGVVHRFELEAPAVRPLEAAIADPGFAPVAELTAQAAEFETWSQFVLAELARW
ncbi:MAG: phosphoesterase [Isosphaera sp.]|nr:phosphoesterase [Isosphaera sp.]